MNQLEINLVKKDLFFLKQYAANLRMHSALYGSKEQALYVEDELVNYMHYTKSIIECTSQPRNYDENPIIKAMMKREKLQALRKEQDYRAFVLMKALEQLSSLEKRLLIDVYVRSLPKQIVLRHQGEVVDSTYYRRLNKACQNLYQLLAAMNYPFS